MARKRYTPETIIRKLSEAELLQGQGKTVAEAVSWKTHPDQEGIKTVSVLLTRSSKTRWKT